MNKQWDSGWGNINRQDLSASFTTSTAQNSRVVWHSALEQDFWAASWTSYWNKNCMKTLTLTWWNRVRKVMWSWDPQARSPLVKVWILLHNPPQQRFVICKADESFYRYVDQNIRTFFLVVSHKDWLWFRALWRKEKASNQYPLISFP